MDRSAGIVGEYLALKDETDADLLAMQVGDFYEFFAEDAGIVADELDLTVSEKSSHGSSYPMAGVPVDDLTPYLRSLVDAGYRVAVADQHEEPDGHARSIARVVSPGTLLATDEAVARYLGAVVRAEDGFGLAFAELTTGRFHASVVGDLSAVIAECYRFAPVELLPGPALRSDVGPLDAIAERTGATITPHDENAFAAGAARRAVRRQFGEGSIESLGLEAPAVRAAGAILEYVNASGIGVEAALTRLTAYRADDHVELDATTQRNLELTEPLTEGPGGALLATTDRTVTSPGTRLLRERLQRPIRDIASLEQRAASIEALVEAPIERSAIRETLESAYDLERLASRATSGAVDGRDLRRVRATLELVPALHERLTADDDLAGSPLGAVFGEVDRSAVDTLYGRLEEALAPDDEAGLFRRGYDDELDDLLDRYEAAHGWIDGLADREKRRLGITHLQVDRNRTDGYYLQVGKSEVEKVPEAYEEIKTLKNSKRYTTEALREREREVLRLEEAREALEGELFDALRARVADRAGLLQAVGRALAELDVYAGLATHAAANGWVRPALGGSGIDIDAGRHPVVERTTEFVPNDVDLSPDRRFLVVTGPNMSGKSTFLRQTALIVLLAQIGSFVPAERARIEPVDAIFTRVGALDELAQGRSTFMVEMQELSRILHTATEESLVILDEVGRGTATYDGISIAWAATEYLHDEVGATTLFATHYHELTALAEALSGVANVHVVAEEADGEVTFLRTVADGAADRSYGVHVADLAGVPAPVVNRARAVLDRLRREQAIETRGGRGETTQAVFDVGMGRFRGSASADGGEPEPLEPSIESVLDELKGTDVNEVPPVELAATVREWQRRLDGE